MTNEDNNNSAKLISLLAVLLTGGGLLGSVFMLIRRIRNIVFWTMAIALMISGVAIVLKVRQKRIEQTGDLIIAQIDGLDPIAKAQVAKYVADQQLGNYSW